MESTIKFKSKFGNHYLYDFNNNIGMLLPPILFDIINKSKISDKSDLDLNFYYKKKYQFLQKNGWFKTSSLERNVSKLLTEQDIINQIANTEQLTFEVTERCNLSCSYCSYGDMYMHHKRRKMRNLDFKTATTIIDYCFSLWNSENNKSKEKIIYIGFYGGEPLLNFKLIEQIVNYTKNKDIFKRIRFTMTTNSILLDKHMDFLVNNNFNLLLSLDGNSSNSVYRKQNNGVNSFNTVCKNIDNLYKRYPIYFKQNVNFNAVLHNANSVEDIYNFIKNRYNKIPLLSELNTYGIKDSKQKEFKNMFVNYESSIISSINKKELIQNLFISIPYYKDLSRFVLLYFNIIRELKDLTIYKNTIHIPTGTCAPFAKKIFVSVTGELFPCEKIERKHPLGKIVNGRIELNFKQIVDYYNGYYLYIKKQCKKCYMQRSCVQCLFNMNTKKNRIYCNTSMDETKFANYLSENIGTLEENKLLFNKIINQIFFK